MKYNSDSFFATFILGLIIFFGIDIIRHHSELSLVFNFINVAANVSICAVFAFFWNIGENITRLYSVYANYLTKKTEALERENNK